MEEKSIDRVTLYQFLTIYFYESELQQITSALGVDYGLLPGRDKDAKVRELIAYFRRRGRLPELLTACMQQRPNMNWQSVYKQHPLSSHTRPPTITQRISNPFYTNGRISDLTLFFGRERLRHEICDALKQRVTISIVGESQIGKSSLLYFLYATHTRWLTEATAIYLDLERVADEADFCEEILTHLGQMGHSLPQLKQVLSHEDVVLLLDEAERLVAADFNPWLPDLLRTLAPKPHFALCVATQRPLATLFPASVTCDATPFPTRFTTKEVGSFTEAESRAFLTSRLAPTPIRFTAAEIDDLLAASANRPAKLQRLARALFDQYTRR